MSYSNGFYYTWRCSICTLYYHICILCGHIYTMSSVFKKNEILKHYNLTSRLIILLMRSIYILDYFFINCWNSLSALLKHFCQCFSTNKYLFWPNIDIISVVRKDLLVDSEVLVATITLSISRFASSDFRVRLHACICIHMVEYAYIMCTRGFDVS
jgi:hypothetical protein